MFSKNLIVSNSLFNWCSNHLNLIFTKLSCLKHQQGKQRYKEDREKRKYNV